MNNDDNIFKDFNELKQELKGLYNIDLTLNLLNKEDSNIIVGNDSYFYYNSTNYYISKTRISITNSFINELVLEDIDKLKLHKSHSSYQANFNVAKRTSNVVSYSFITTDKKELIDIMNKISSCTKKTNKNENKRLNKLANKAVKKLSKKRF